MNYIILNNKLVHKDALKLDFHNRGFFYGDGFFETCKVVNREVFNFDNHYSRITKTASALEISFVLRKKYLTQKIQELIVKNNITSSARLKIIIFRNSPGKYLPKKNTSNYLIEISAINQNNFVLNKKGLVLDWYENELKAKTQLSTLKTLNSMYSVLCSIYARNNNLDDAILFNTEYSPVETSSSNLFIVKDNVVFTSSTKDGCVEGTMRSLILSILDVREITLSKKLILKADECFLSNALGIRWVGSVNDREFLKYDYATTLVKKINCLI